MFSASGHNLLLVFKVNKPLWVIEVTLNGTVAIGEKLLRGFLAVSTQLDSHETRNFRLFLVEKLSDVVSKMKVAKIFHFFPLFFFSVDLFK